MNFPYHILGAFAVFAVALLPQSASAKCVARVVAGSGGVKTTILAVAPDSGSADLAAAGYQDASCGAVDKAAYRAKVCSPKDLGNRGIQRQLELQAGISFARLCSAARVEAGLTTQVSDTAASAGLSSPNRRQAVAKGGPAMVGPLGAAGVATAPAGGN
jgi:hypothetical protein